MRDFDIPSVLKVKNPGTEIFSLAGLFNLPPGKITDVHLGALHDSRRRAAYSAVLNSLAGGVIEYVGGPENFKLPQQVANAIARREAPDLAGVEDAKRKAEALANRPDGTTTLPVVHPPAPQVAVPPVSTSIVGGADGADFTPPPLPSQVEKAAEAPPAPAPAPVAPAAAPVKGKAKGKSPQSADSDQPASSSLSDL